MNRPGTIRYTLSMSNVGAVLQSASLATPRDPPLRGEIVRVEVTKAAGPATTVSFQLTENVSGSIRAQWLTESFPAVKQPLPAPYEVAAPADLRFEALTDDGGATTNLDIVVEIRGPF